MQPFFTTNEQEYQRLEGLYITERVPPASIKGVFLNAVGIAGECVRGPVGKIVEITSAARFREVFGGRDFGSGGTYAGKVHLALLNKPFGRLYVTRVAAAAAVAASFTLETAAGGAGPAVLRVDATSPGTWGNDVGIKVQAATDGDANKFDLLVKYLGTVKRYRNLNIFSTNDNTLSVVGTDDGNWISLTKLAGGRPVNHAAGVDGADADGYVNLGETVAAFTSVAGTEGAIAATDYTATGKAIDLLTGYRGIGIVMVAEPASAHYAAIKAKILTNASTVADRMFVVGADAETTTLAAAVTDAATYRHDRIIYAFNHTYTIDPETASEQLARPEAWMASILSQIDVDIHPGEEDTKQYTAGIRRLYNESYAREDYISMREAGICGLEKDDGFAFVSGVTTSLTSGRTEITRRRMADYILLSVAAFLKYSVKKKNTPARRLANKSMVSAFLRELGKAGRVVDVDDDGKPQFLVDTEALNTTASRAAGLEKLLVRVKLVSHMLHLVLEAELGTNTVIEVTS
jgi:hypothetical protein